MCKANEYMNKIRSLVSQINNETEILKKELKKVENVQLDLLHKIEGTNFNASEGYALAYSLKITRNKRREIKNMLANLEIIEELNKNIPKVQSVIQKQVNKQTEGKYNTRIVNL